jgi:hypothetical protein
LRIEIPGGTCIFTVNASLCVQTEFLITRVSVRVAVSARDGRTVLGATRGIGVEKDETTRFRCVHGARDVHEGEIDVFVTVGLKNGR